jgi:small subunit ribosomal protein S18
MDKTNEKKSGLVEFSYKNYKELENFITDRARIIPKKRTSLSAKQQRQLTREIKRARHLGLLPFSSRI